MDTADALLLALLLKKRQETRERSRSLWSHHWLQYRDVECAGITNYIPFNKNKNDIFNKICI